MANCLKLVYKTYLHCKPQTIALDSCFNIICQNSFIQNTDQYIKWQSMRTITTGNYNVLFSKYYEILKIERNATQEEIKKAYIQHTKEFHPDSARSKDKDFNQEEFLKIREAYDILGNPVSRKMYDLEVFGKISDVNRFSTGEYELYAQKIEKMKKEKEVENLSKDKKTKSSGLFTVSPRIRQLLNYLYGFIFAATISMYLLGQRSKKDDSK